MGINKYTNKTDEYTATASDYKYLSASDGSVSDGQLASKVTELIPAIEGDIFFVSGHAKYLTTICAFYDKNELFIESFLNNYDGYTANLDKVIAPKRTKYVRFCTYGTSVPLEIYKYDQVSLRHADYLLNEYIEQMQKSNILFGKKYVACGDSFTEGDFSSYVDDNGNTGTDSDAYDNDKLMWKTYPWHIADRNNMTLVNEAKSGSDFTNIDGASNAFSVDRYKSIPLDTDYITLMFGLNETSIADDVSLLGTKDDTTNATLWGAYNIVFEYFLTNIPFAKIGVIISDAWMTESYSNALKEICKYWGIPYLDLKNDHNVPMGIYGRTDAVSEKAKALRNAAFMVADDDSHPNYKAHIYRSTIIESFLRSL